MASPGESELTWPMAIACASSLQLSEPNTHAEYQLADARPGHRCAVAAHQHHPVRSERAGERGAFLRLDHQHVGIAELIALIPERHVADDGAEMKYRHDLLARYGKGQHRVGVVMAHGE